MSRRALFFSGLAFHIADSVAFLRLACTCKDAARSTSHLRSAKKKEFSRVITFRGDKYPVLPCGAVHGAVVSRAGTLAYNDGYYDWGLSGTLSMVQHVRFTFTLCISTGFGYVHFDTFDQTRKLYCARCAVCSRYHTFHVIFNNRSYLLYWTCTDYTVRRCVENTYLLAHRLKRRQEACAAVVQYAKGVGAAK